MLVLVLVLVLVLMLQLVLGHPQIDLVVVATSEATQVATTTKSIAGASSSGDYSRREGVSPVVFFSGCRFCGRRRALVLADCVIYSGVALFTPRLEPQYACYRNA